MNSTVQMKPTKSYRIGFFLVPGFSMLTWSSAVEALREANRQSGLELYSWRLFSMDGGPVKSCSGAELQTETVQARFSPDDAFFICAGFDPLRVDSRIFALLRQMNVRGVTLAGLGTGADVLAAAGLLNGYRATRHWEDAIAAVERFPNVDWTGNLIEMDRNRYSCSGGMATFDLMLNMIEERFGRQLTSKICDQFQYERVRSRFEEQRPFVEQRFATANSKVAQAVKLMENNVEDVLSLDEIAQQTGVSRRQLERLFVQHVGQSPCIYYRALRLRKARALLRHTNLAIVQVAAATGFVSHSHMTKSYRNEFGKSPREERCDAA